MAKIDITSTVQDFISMKSSDEATYYNFSILEYSNGIEYTVSNLIYDYLPELKEKAELYELSDLQFLRYKYRPDLLAYDIYGAEELFFVILALNGIIDDAEFDFKKVYLIDASQLSKLLGKIYSTEYTFINTNRSQITSLRKNNEVVGL